MLPIIAPSRLPSPPKITTTSAWIKNVPFRAWIERQECAAGDPRDAGEERGERGDQHEQPVDIDAGRVHHLAVVDARAHHRADLRFAGRAARATDRREYPNRMSTKR